MKEGKLSQAVLERSIMRTIKNIRTDVVNIPTLGREASELLFGSEAAAFSSRVVWYEEPGRLLAAITEICNVLVCKNSEPAGAAVTMLFPETMEEGHMKAVITEVESGCEIHNMQLLGCNVQVSKNVLCPVVTINGVGKMDGRFLTGTKADYTGLDVVITKYIALEGTAVLARNKKTRLSGILPSYLIEDAEGFMEYISIEKEARIATDYGASGLYPAGEGGIFGALWEFASLFGVGLDLDMRRLPMRQETVEICECLQINPYELLSGGAMIAAVQDGFGFCGLLAENGISAAVIGKTTDKKDRILRNEDEVRHLTHAVQDSIYSAL